MISTLMIYCLSVAALVSVAAFFIERAFATLGWARRTVWIAGMMTSLCLPLLMMSMQGGTQHYVAVGVEAPIAADVAEQTGAPNVSSFKPTFLNATNSALEIAWPLLSIACIAFAFVGWLRLRQAARTWQTEIVDDTRVRVSDDMGPAVIGLVKPEIVVPRWLLSASITDRAAAIAHERSHIKAGDPIVLLGALLVIALMPWNLPLWWQLRRLRFAIEVDCDQRVLRAGTSIEIYGEMLLTVGQRSQTAMSLGAIALIEPVSQLERRIRIMMTGKYRYAMLLVVASLALSTSLVAVATQLEAPSLAMIVPPSISASAISTKTVLDDSRKNLAPVESKVDVKSAATMPSTKQAVSPEIRKPTVSPPAKKSIAVKVAPQNSEIADTSNAMLTKQASIPTDVSTTTTAAASSTDRPLKRTKIVAPIYPDAARRDYLYGWVEVAYAVDRNGEVQEAHVYNAEPKDVFDEAALVAVRQWRYEPAIKDGQPVTTPTKIRLRFAPTETRYGASEPKAVTATTNASAKNENLNIKFKDIDVRTVLKLLSDTSGQNILVRDKVAGVVTIELRNTPWQDALKAICEQAGLKQRLSGNVILIEPK